MLRSIKEFWSWLFGTCSSPHNCEVTLNSIRVASGELIDAFEAFAQQCFDTGQTEQLRQTQKLARWVAVELAAKVGPMPFEDDGNSALS